MSGAPAYVGILAEAPVFSPTQIIIALLIVLFFVSIAVILAVVGAIGVFRLGRGNATPGLAFFGWLAAVACVLLMFAGLATRSWVLLVVPGVYALIALAGLSGDPPKQPPPPTTADGVQPPSTTADGVPPPPEPSVGDEFDRP